MTPSPGVLPDPQHISATSVCDRDAGEHQADIQVDGETIVAVSYNIGEPVEVVIMSPIEGEIVATHEFEPPRKNGVLESRDERTASIISENASISFHRNMFVQARWRPDDGLNVSVRDPNSDNRLGTYKFDDPVDPETRTMNMVCWECQAVQLRERGSVEACKNCGSTDIREVNADSNN